MLWWRHLWRAWKTVVLAGAGSRAVEAGIWSGAIVWYERHRHASPGGLMAGPVVKVEPVLAGRETRRATWFDGSRSPGQFPVAWKAVELSHAVVWSDPSRHRRSVGIIALAAVGMNEWL